MAWYPMEEYVNNDYYARQFVHEDFDNVEPKDRWNAGRLKEFLAGVDDDAEVIVVVDSNEDMNIVQVIDDAAVSEDKKKVAIGTTEKCLL